MKSILGSLLFICAIVLAPTTSHASEQLLKDYFEASFKKDDDKAASAELELLNVEPTSIGFDDQEYFVLLIEIGYSNLDDAQYDRATAAFQKSIDFGVSTFGTNDLQLRMAYQGLAKVKKAEGKNREALVLLQKSLGVAETVLGTDNPSLQEELNALAEIEAELNNSDSSQAYASRGTRLYQIATLQRRKLKTLGGGDRNNEDDQCVDDNGKNKSDGFQRLEVFYGTNRTPTGDRVATNAYSADYDQSGDIHYGSVFITVPCKRELGAIPLPKWWKGSFRPNKSKHIVLEDYQQFEDGEDFWKLVAETIGDSDRKEALVFIHGFNVDFTEAAARTAQLATDLELDGAPLFYDWPSKGEYLSYAADRELATTQAIIDDATQFFADVAEKTGAEKVHLIAHSLGNEVLLRALEELSDNQYRTATEKPFDQLVFASADVNVTNFKALVKETARLANGMTLYSSQNDLALMLSAFNSEMKRAGDASQQVIAEEVVTVDTTEASGDFVGHNDFAGSGLDDLRAVIWHSLSPSDRCIISAKTIEDGNYWSFEPQCRENVFKAAIFSIRRLGFERAIELAQNQIQNSADENNAEQKQRWEAVLAQIEKMNN